MSITRRRHPVAPDGDAADASRSGRVRPWRRVGHGALIVAAATAALSLAGPFALRPFVDAARAAGTAGEIPVAFVLDFGSPSSEVVGCVNVQSTSNRYGALADFLSQQRLIQARYADSGLLCSINGIPATGCGQIVKGGYVYWSYFTGSDGSWVYSNTGASATVTPGDVEGWRFQDPGAGNPSDPPPHGAAQYSSICGSGSTTTTTTTTTAAPGPTVGAGASTGPQPAHGSPPPPSSVPGTSDRHTTTTTSSSPGSTTPGSTSPSGTSTSLPGVRTSADAEAGLANARHAAGGGSDPTPLVVGGLLIVALAVAGYLRWRKRPDAA